MPRATILVVEDEDRLRHSLAELLAAEGHEVREAADGDVALATLVKTARLPDTILLDLKMPHRNGLETLQVLKAAPEWQHIPVVVLTAFGGSEQTIAAMKAGAYDYLTKPFDADEVLRTVSRATEVAHLTRELDRLRAHSVGGAGDDEHGGLIGHHPAMREVFKLIGRVAPTEAAVLITGETGTGKELVARAIHRHSARAAGPLVAVNCAAIPHDLLESELFGHEKGAFTGAHQAKPGRLEMANGGTLFLDEIGELSADLQAKLLRVLQEHTLERLGATESRAVDFRLLAATNRDLRAAIEGGRFREDLFYRLNVVCIELPPLRCRRSDIPELAEYFLHRLRRARPDGPSGYTDQALQALLLHEYRGNIRELENIIQRAFVLARGPLVAVDDLPLLPRGGAAERNADLQDLISLPLEAATRELERRLIVRALTESRGNKAEAARKLAVHRQYLYVKLKEFGLE